MQNYDMPIRWQRECIRLLGIPVGVDIDITDWWMKILKNMEKETDGWIKRQ
jgi:hypothetical protein